MVRRRKPETEPIDVDSEDSDPRGRQAPSKTALKAEAHALRQLGQQLAELPVERRAVIPMPDELREAIDRYNQTTAHGARKRELQHLGKMMRRVDPEPLRRAVEAATAGARTETAAMHAAERWRDELVADDAALTRWMNNHPDTEIQHLRSLVRAARRDGAAEDPARRQPRSYRDLYRFIRTRLSGTTDDSGIP